MQNRFMVLLACLALGDASVASAQTTPSVQDPTLINLRRAKVLGLQVAKPLEAVMLPDDPGAPTADDIRKTAQQTRDNLAATMAATQKNFRWLGFTLGTGSTIVQLGQYAGGAGAGLFGLAAATASTTSASQGSGRNAAYAGGVAFLVTLLSDRLDLPGKKTARDACAGLRSDQFGLVQQTYGWEGQANNADFRRNFFDASKGDYQKFNDEVKSFTMKCLAQ